MKHCINEDVKCSVDHKDNLGPCGWCDYCKKWIRPNHFEDECKYFNREKQYEAGDCTNTEYDLDSKS